MATGRKVFLLDFYPVHNPTRERGGATIADVANPILSSSEVPLIWSENSANAQQLHVRLCVYVGRREWEGSG